MESFYNFFQILEEKKECAMYYGMIFFDNVPCLNLTAQTNFQSNESVCLLSFIFNTSLIKCEVLGRRNNQTAKDNIPKFS